MSWERIQDANGNRAVEGLRVLEDVARFLCDDAVLSAEAKELRHRLRAAVPPVAAAARDTPGDVGTAIGTDSERRRAHLPALLRANAARVQEALRCLEESAKLAGDDGAVFEALRYRVYALESALLAALPAWRLWRARVYVLVDSALCADPRAVAAAAARGGAEVIQLRAKALTPRAYRELAARVQEGAVANGALFVVNDHAAVARVLAADGLHLGQDDLAIADARRVVGPLCAIGCSVHELAQLHAAQDAGADYVGLGPMYTTATKAHEPERSPALLDAARPELRLPSFAIGGLDAARVRALRGRIPHGVAVAGAVCRAADPARAAAELRAALEEDAPCAERA